MAGWAKASSQARTVVKELQSQGELKSVRTAANYQAALKTVAQFIKDEYREGRGPGDLKSMTPAYAEAYLERRGQSVGQSQLNTERQAVQLMQQKLTQQLPYTTEIDGKEKEVNRLALIKSERDQALNSRAYSNWQINEIAARQTPHNALATQIAAAAGLRAHELLTLRPANERPADERPSRDEKFAVRDGERYTVTGKGGLTREVLIPRGLAERLEAVRYAVPQRITDRRVFYQQHYAIGAGKSWSNSFSKASQRALEWSTGAHGVRHTYAQQRMSELQLAAGLDYRNALEVVSQEMGHFRPDITEIYLR
jgi:integrase